MKRFNDDISKIIFEVFYTVILRQAFIFFKSKNECINWFFGTYSCYPESQNNVNISLLTFQYLILSGFVFIFK